MSSRAGFGGSVWALVDRSDADGFVGSWLTRYREEFPERAASSSVVVSRPAGPTGEVTDTL